MSDQAHIALMEAVAKHFFGEPNRALSKRFELRFGSRGSKSIDLKKGTWFDHEAGEGGGPLDLIKRKVGLTEARDCYEWAERQGYWHNGGTGGSPRPRTEVAHYNYVNETGKLLFQKVRYEPKDFRLRRPNGRDWIWDLGDVRRVVYRLPEVIETVGMGNVIVIAEGEKDVDNLWRIGVPATCNWEGAGRWGDEQTPTFAGADVCIVADNDKPGRKHAGDVAAKLNGVAKRVRVLDLASDWPQCPEKGDVSDWIKQTNGTAEQFYTLIIKLAEWQPEPLLPWIVTKEWDDVAPPDPEYTVPDRIPRHHVTLFSGEGAAGKSTIGLHLAAAHAYGGDWLNAMPTKGPAIFIDCEDGVSVIHRRLYAITQYYGCKFKDLAAGGLHLLSLVGEDAVMATATRGGKVEPTPLYGKVLQAASDIKPETIVIASSANVYAGSEIDRTQVNQFVLGLLVKIAIAADGSVVLISHPSLTGISSGSGISGSTQWHNAVRGRMYLKGIKPNGGDEQPDSDLRVLEFKKNQYGPVTSTIMLHWKNGMFLPETSGSSPNTLAREAKAEQVFRDLLARTIQQGRPVSHKTTAHNYAPKAFVKMPEANGLSKHDLELAMERLFKANAIHVVQYGSPSKGWERIEFVANPPYPRPPPDHPLITP